MNPREIVLFILGAPVRHLLTVVGAWLLSHGAAPDATAAFVSSGFDTVIGIVVIAVGIGLSYVTKFIAIQRTPPSS